MHIHFPCWQSRVSGSQERVQEIPEQFGALTLDVQEVEWQHEAGTQSSLVWHSFCLFSILYTLVREKQIKPVRKTIIKIITITTNSLFFLMIFNNKKI